MVRKVTGDVFSRWLHGGTAGHFDGQPHPHAVRIRHYVGVSHDVAVGTEDHSRPGGPLARYDRRVRSRVSLTAQDVTGRKNLDQRAAHSSRQPFQTGTQFMQRIGLFRLRICGRRGLLLPGCSL